MCAVPELCVLYNLQLQNSRPMTPCLPQAKPLQVFLLLKYYDTVLDASFTMHAERKISVLLGIYDLLTIASRGTAVLSSW